MLSRERYHSDECKLRYMNHRTVFICTKSERQRNNGSAVITARKRSLRRLCFYTCLSVHRGAGIPACLAGLQVGLQVHTQEWGSPDPQTGGVSEHALRQTPLPTADGYCCGRYASYWNAFLFWNQISNSEGIPFLCQITLMGALFSAKFPPRDVTFLVSGAFERDQFQKLH